MSQASLEQMRRELEAVRAENYLLRIVYGDKMSMSPPSNLSVAIRVAMIANLFGVSPHANYSSPRRTLDFTIVDTDKNKHTSGEVFQAIVNILTAPREGIVTYTSTIAEDDQPSRRKLPALSLRQKAPSHEQEKKR